MRPRFVGHIGLADVITTVNAMLGFIAIVAALVDPRLGARLILLAAMGDGLDGVVARHYGGTPIGKQLDSLADVASFGVAPALVVFLSIRNAWNLDLTTLTLPLVLTILIPAIFLGTVVIRLAFYTANTDLNGYTEGVPSTLAATILGAAVLAQAETPTILLAGTGVLAYFMVIQITYPDLLTRDTLFMGVIQGLAVLVPNVLGRAFPYALLTLAIAYLVFAPRWYWRAKEESRPSHSSG